tara:strand:- start:2795 stop:3199 length:405 start_codon:yes stop_codon:yes gene_type:complete
MNQHEKKLIEHTIPRFLAGNKVNVDVKVKKINSGFDVDVEYDMTVTATMEKNGHKFIGTVGAGGFRAPIDEIVWMLNKAKKPLINTAMRNMVENINQHAQGLYISQNKKLSKELTQKSSIAEWIIKNASSEKYI